MSKGSARVWLGHGLNIGVEYIYIYIFIYIYIYVSIMNIYIYLLIDMFFLFKRTPFSKLNPKALDTGNYPQHGGSWGAF